MNENKPTNGTIDQSPPLSALTDKYTRPSGHVFMSGNQALVRLPVQQRLRDIAAGWNTAGFISGYRGSPLGRYDMELWQAGDWLKSHHVHFQPGVNEDLAATAVWGTQQVPNLPGPLVDGIFGIWYGKGPGVDRSGDALKHANAAGTSSKGGVIALAGDDHAAKSSTQAHQSDQAFIAAGIPVLYPSNVQEILDYGLLGIAMSRHAGCWVALKLVTDVVEGSSSVYVSPNHPEIHIPEEELEQTPDRYIKRFEPAPLQESRLYNLRLPAALEFARNNRLNRIEQGGDNAKIGIVSCGKSWSDVKQALAILKKEGLQTEKSDFRLLKIGMVWPLDADIVQEFAKDLDTIIVVEEKRPLLEDQIKSILFDLVGIKPRVLGKFDGASAWMSARGLPAFSMVGEFNPSTIADRISSWIEFQRPVVKAPDLAIQSQQVDRAPTFCSGCPHSTSTKVPDGSMALAGIGCHSIALLLDPVATGPISHMGAEGVMWVGQAPFTDKKHVFANIGDGTYYHSGFLAIRQSIAAKVSITYKLLLNGFVSMTGGQPIEGELTPAQLSMELLAEGVRKVVVVTDDPEKYTGQLLPEGVSVHHREQLDSVQRDLRDLSGVTVLIYDQMCATERRRQRKRGKLPEPNKRSFINAAVCEGCGDCGVKSNCLSVEPLQTELGRKRRINQNSCNKDFSCIQGFCPSFVTVEGGILRKATPQTKKSPHGIQLPEPTLPTIDAAHGVIVTGIGGTGVITVGAIVTMAAHLDGIFASSLDLTGLAQKYGAVMSHIRLAKHADELNSYRLGKGEADLILGCDLIVTASAEAIERMAPGRTRVVLNSDVTPTREFAKNADWDPNSVALQYRVQNSALELNAIPASAIATELMGDPLAANLFIVGVAWQKGWLPISRASIENAIRLNGVSINENLASFAWGRLAAHDPSLVEEIRKGTDAGTQVVQLQSSKPKRLDEIVSHRYGELTAFQNEDYAKRYRAMVDRVATLESKVCKSDRLAKEVAKYYYKLLAFKDEYEVARLFVSESFRDELKRTFEGKVKLKFHLGAGPFARVNPRTGEVRKSEVGGWMLPVFRVIASMRFVRGSFLDPFRKSEERKSALAEIAQYERDIERLLEGLNSDRIAVAVEIASLPEKLRGYGHVRSESAKKVAQQREQLWQRWGATAPSSFVPN